MKRRFEGLLQRAVSKASNGGVLISGSLPPLVLEVPKDPALGDLATPIALALARAERRPPRELAEAILRHFEDPQGFVAAAEIAGPGYINFRLSPSFWDWCLKDLDDPHFRFPDLGRGKRVLIEFVSGNPTGPLHVGHGRGAVTGDVLARLMAATGFRVTREYYVNDAGRQIDALGKSTLARVRELCGAPLELPANGYPGEYLRAVASAEMDAVFARLAAAAGRPCPQSARERLELLAAREETAARICAEHAAAAILEGIKGDLALCGISFDSFVSERELRDSGIVGRALDAMRRRGLLYERDGAQWFRSQEFGDEKDRVVVRADGELTYFASDIGYHLQKLERGYDLLINVWGADHHGYIGRVRAAMQALGYDPQALQVVLVQIVNLSRSGQPVRMGKRSGEFLSLREIVEEVGPDAARFFFLMRKSDAQLDFDLDLAKKQGAENPVFYVQYAHARCCSLFREAAQVGTATPDAAQVSTQVLAAPEELALVKRLSLFPDAVEEAARDLEPHRLVFYLMELAGSFHRFYNRHRVLGADPEIGQARLLLVKLTREVVRRGLSLLGVAAPERM